MKWKQWYRDNFFAYSSSEVPNTQVNIEDKYKDIY